MLKRLIIDNFMAHSHTELELGPGITTLVGLNNTGKSAIVEALRCLVTNPTPKTCIRHGTKEARVELELDDGIRITWVRRKNWARYIIARPDTEPVIFNKLGRGIVPEEVTVLLRLTLVPLKDRRDQNIDVHLGNQRQPIFLLDQPPTAIASFFASSTESAHLLAMQQRLKDLTRERQKEARERMEQLEQLAISLDRLASLPGLSLAAQACRERLKRLRNISLTIPKLTILIEKLRLLATEQAKLTTTLNVVWKLRPPPSWSNIPSRLAIWLAIRTRLTATQQAVTATGTIMAGLRMPPTIIDCRSLFSLLKQQTRLIATAGAGQQRLAVMTGLAPPPLLQNYISIVCLLNQHQQLTIALTTIRTTLNQTRVELLKRQTALEMQIRIIGRCPLCGSQFNAMYFLKNSHIPLTRPPHRGRKNSHDTA
ncbi:DNA repair protein RecN (modular protein) [Desulfovibrionales bacterium]